MKLYATKQTINGHKFVHADPGSIWETEHGYVPFDQLPDGNVTPADETPAPSLESSESEASNAEWKNHFSPQFYLKRFPNGPNAELARKIIGE